MGSFVGFGLCLTCFELPLSSVSLLVISYALYGNIEMKSH